MRLWMRASGTERCGKCGEPIAVGAPVLVITRTGERWRLLRCEACAEEPVPADLREATS